MRFQLQTEEGIKCKAPFGVSCFDDSKGARKSIELSLEDDELVKFFQTFDEHVINSAVANASQWFPKHKDLTRDQIKNMYYPMLQFDTNDKGYPPRLHTKINTDGKNHVNVLIYSEVNGAPQYRKGIVDDIVKYSELIVIVEAGTMWFQSKQFGITLLATDVMVFPKTERKEFDFIWNKQVPVKVDNLTPKTETSSSFAPSYASSEISGGNSVLLIPGESDTPKVTLVGKDEPAMKKPRSK
jgi:hypothetical protein